jgi:hypothetical protein
LFCFDIFVCKINAAEEGPKAESYGKFKLAFDQTFLCLLLEKIKKSSVAPARRWLLLDCYHSHHFSQMFFTNQILIILFISLNFNEGYIHCNCRIDNVEGSIVGRIRNTETGSEIVLGRPGLMASF